MNTSFQRTPESTVTNMLSLLRLQPIAAVTVALAAFNPNWGAPLSAQDTTTVAEEAPQGRRVVSWTSDRRAFVEGDLLTVFVDERVLAAASADDYARDDRRIGGSASFGSTRMSARIDADANSNERGVSQRDERFQTEITVRVLEVQGGNLRIEGTKSFQVDEHEQEVVLRGWVRPNDISGLNIVNAWRVANLEFLYESNGELIKPKRGMLQKLLGIVF